jgi:hypothetical protein
MKKMTGTTENKNKSRPKRRRDRHALKNVVSMRVSDDELLLLKRIRAATSKSASEIMRDAFALLQNRRAPEFQS